MTAVTTFELAQAAHVSGKDMVLARRVVDGREVNRGWFETHRLAAWSPTGVNGVIDLLKRTSQ